MKQKYDEDIVYMLYKFHIGTIEKMETGDGFGKDWYKGTLSTQISNITHLEVLRDLFDFFMDGEHNMELLRIDIETLKMNVDTLRTDIDTIKRDIKVIKHGIVVLKNNMEQIEMMMKI
jgi:hypothetical protein